MGLIGKATEERCKRLPHCVIIMQYVEWRRQPKRQQSSRSPVDSEETGESPSQAQGALTSHPLTEISLSPGHLLLLKLFQRQESQISRAVNLKETRLDGLKRDAFHLSSLFFAFHALSLTLLFTSSSVTGQAQTQMGACKNWWVPLCLSALTSLVLIIAVQFKVSMYWKVMRALQRERSDGRTLARTVQELRMKGSSFDLSKELQLGTKRMKSSSVDGGWRPVRWMKRNAVAFCLAGFAGLVAAACKFILCS
ncbi:uncharacterized protein LOC109842164 [Asparagus officinalis]|uniref:uncharacterized protein LOC109842164 n=1 Tax=Asparagus officinalis TaxID=4686 RepID=UPI00098E6D85|nr:uncharacterized protein LOC109842164 [Asparagus officinalis]